MKFIGKCLLIEEANKKVLVFGDLHLGYGGSLRNSGVMVPAIVGKQMVEESRNVFEKVGKVEEIVLVGDVKHEFGSILQEEREEMNMVVNYLLEWCEKLVIIRGNHDKILPNIVRGEGIEVRDYYVWRDYCFLHGDKDFEEIYDKKINTWVMGHSHPAITLREAAKAEKYKCFLVGKFKGKKVVIMPSFFPFNEGTDPRDYDVGLACEFDFDNFEVMIVGDDLEVLNFGLMKKLKDY